jgi:THO complex subunit 4
MNGYNPHSSTTRISISIRRLALELRRGALHWFKTSQIFGFQARADFLEFVSEMVRFRRTDRHRQTDGHISLAHTLDALDTLTWILLSTQLVSTARHCFWIRDIDVSSRFISPRRHHSQELFSQVGRVIKSGVNYGPNGRSKGTAEVELSSYAEAQRAVARYNGVKLDGRPLSIAIVGGAPANANAPITSRLSGLKQPAKANNNNNKKATPKRGKATAKVVAAAKKPAAKPTAAELDASLDAYKASADVQMAA